MEQMENSERASDRLPEKQPEALDPFAFFPGIASKIAGLGGTEQRPDLAYGFHTLYVACAPGYCTFSVDFADFWATHGLLHLRVHMISAEGGQAHVTTVDRMQMTDLLAKGGKVELRFESLPGTLYALFAQVLDTTDARASGVTVTLDRPAGPDDDPQSVLFEPTAFGGKRARDTDQVSSSDAPTLASPVSQVMTAAQLGEPAFAKWCDQFEGDRSDPVRVWQEVYVLQALDRYGMMAHRARGYGYSALDTNIPVLLAKRGCLVSISGGPGAISAEGDARDALIGRLPLITDADQAARSRIEVLPQAEPEIEPAAAGPFDFLWSIGRLEELGDQSSIIHFLDAGLAALRPGGIAIHMTKVLLDPPWPDPGSDRAGILTRAQIERLSLHLLGSGHHVAQLRFHLGNKPRDNRQIDRSAQPFGWIIRRR